MRKVLILLSFTSIALANQQPQVQQAGSSECEQQCDYMYSLEAGMCLNQYTLCQMQHGQSCSIQKMACDSSAIQHRDSCYASCSSS